MASLLSVVVDGPCCRFGVATRAASVTAQGGSDGTVPTTLTIADMCNSSAYGISLG